jgi:hypothetical protein
VTVSRSDFTGASPSLAPALGSNDGKATTDALDTASIAKAASDLIIVDLLMLVKSIPTSQRPLAPIVARPRCLFAISVVPSGTETGV